MIKANRAPKFPYGSEKEAKRVSQIYMSVLNEEMQKSSISKISENKFNADSEGFREDGVAETADRILADVLKRTLKKIKKIGLDLAFYKIAKKVQKNSVAEWKRILRETTGHRAKKEDYADGKYDDIIGDWEERNSEIADEIIKETIEKIRESVKTGINEHKSAKEIAKNISEIISSETKHAKRSGMDEVSRLNTAIEKKNCEIAGCKRYMWITKTDSRVRESHRELHGKIFFWDEPPEMWHIKNGTKIMDGRFCNPGEDYRCRCSAVPIFDNL